MYDNCPWCGMPRGDVIQGWTCGSIASWLDDSPQIQSAACVEIVRLKAKVEKLEDFIKVVKQAKDGESGLDGFEKKVLEALAALEKSHA